MPRSMIAIIVALVCAPLVSVGAASAETTAVAASAAPGVQAAAAKPVTDFDPGYIISDENFYDPAAMTEHDVQSFLERQKCAPTDSSVCLADYRVDTPTEPTQFAHCARYQGEPDQRASAIVVGVARACGISPMVLLVLVQKEQSLVTRPSAYGYQRATGYGCPDTADCDTRYFGLFNQLYNAAWQFREYGVSPGWRYHVGSVRVQFNPAASCGSTLVRIRNQATANLYNYTPYQPDAAALKHPDGSGSDCSTYGNLNFSRIYQRWFGSPTAVRTPVWWGACLTFPGGIGCQENTSSEPGGMLGTP